ncbi:hypothetical protein [Paenibacillus sp. FSL K6-1230]|uniref:hypothetical protein n=1 Tax=Paenibacillus sp. FSL K6-1230 TaxID=2921603 RepID=UPI0030F7F82A
MNGVICLPQTPTIDFLTKTLEIERKFIRDLSIPKIMMSKLTLWLLISSVVTVATALFLIFYSLVPSVSAIWPVRTSLLLASVSMVLLQFSIFFSHSVARKRHPKYALFITNKKINYSFDADFIFAFRCDFMLELLGKPQFQSIEIDELIDYFSKKSETIKFRRWVPVTLTGLIMFPLWSEFIGFKIDNGWGMIIFLFILSGFVAYFFNMLYSILRATLLSKAIKYDELVNVLSTVRSLM